MGKHKNKILVTAVILAVLAFAWFGGNSNKSDTVTPTALAQSTASASPASETGVADDASTTSSESGVAEVASTPLTGSAETGDAAPASSESATSRDASTPLSESATSGDVVPDLSGSGTVEASPALSGSVASGSIPETSEQAQDIYLTDPVPEGKPTPVEPQDVTLGDDSFTVTLSVRCDTILDNMSRLHKEKGELVPADGVIFPATEVTAYEGESVFNILLREMRRAQIHMEFRNTPIYNSAYIMGIQNLYEFDTGELSGWMYRVTPHDASEAWFPNYGCSRYQLQPGDVIEWLYTCDLGRDLGEYTLGRQLDE